MNLINNVEKEKKRMLDWAVENSKKCSEMLSEIPRDRQSYFVETEAENLCEEYDFDTLIQCKSLLETQWGKEDYMKKMILPVSTAIFKERAIADTVENGDLNDKQIDLPVHIYNF